MKSIYNQLTKFGLTFEGVISDDDFLLTNRTDYLMGTISAISSFIDDTNIPLKYRYRDLLDFLNSYFRDINKKTFNIYCVGEGMSLYGFFVWLILGGWRNCSYASIKDDSQAYEFRLPLYRKLYDNFCTKKRNQPTQENLSIILANSRNPLNSKSAIEIIKKSQNFLVVLVDYGHRETEPLREKFEELGLFPHVTLAGHGIIFPKLT